MPRQARLDYPSALHHVIGRGIDGLYIFNELKDKREFLRRIKKRLDESSLRFYGWCLMGNHFHFLIQTGKTPLAEFMRSIMTGYAIYYNKTHKRKWHLFQNLEDMKGGGSVHSLGSKEKESKVQGDEKQMYDKRILGLKDFMERVLNRLETEELPIGPFRDIIDLLTRLACYYQLDKEEIQIVVQKKIEKHGMFLAGIYDERTSGYPIKTFGYDKSCACKNLTGQCWKILKKRNIKSPSPLNERNSLLLIWKVSKANEYRDLIIYLPLS